MSSIMPVPRETLETKSFTKEKLRFKKVHIPLYIMGGICLCFVFLFSYVPLAGWIIAFHRYLPGMRFEQMTWVGLENFRSLLYFTFTWDALRNTLIFGTIGIVLSPLAPTVAILITEVFVKPFKSVVQTLVTFPYFVSWILVFALALALFGNDGFVNQMLARIGMEKVNPIGSLEAVYPFQTALSLWKNLGFSTIIYLAALTGIDPQLLEAVEIDGGGRWAKIWNIKVPAILPTYFILLILNIGNFLNTGFEQYWVFWNPLVQQRIMVIDVFTYLMGVQLRDFGIATAIGMLRTIVAVILLLSANFISKKVRGESVL